MDVNERILYKSGILKKRMVANLRNNCSLTTIRYLSFSVD